MADISEKIVISEHSFLTDGSVFFIKSMAACRLFYYLRTKIAEMHPKVQLFVSIASPEEYYDVLCTRKRLQGPES